MTSSSVTRQRMWTRPLWVAGLMLLAGLLLVACQSTPPAAEPAPTEAPAPTDTPVAAEEPAATETPEAEEEPVATETPAAEEEPEVTGTPAAEEEPAATGTPVAEEEPEATGTPAAEEEADSGEAAMSDAAAYGEYIAVLTGGCGCHFNRDLGAMAGGNRFEGPFGEVFARNITPDEETGIGSWSAEEIAAALQLGVRPDGTQLHPIMPYRAFSVLSDQEALDVAAYLLSLEPVANEVSERDLANEPAAFTPAVAPPAEPHTDPVARGEMLVTIARCGACHTPTNDDGSPNMDMYLSGAMVPNSDDYAANITPDDETGIGRWSEEEIANFMRTGEFPDGSLTVGAMAQQIERRFSRLTEEDALAIAAYLKSIPAVSSTR